MKRNSSPYFFTEQRFLKWTREGRGTGMLMDYKPWLRITNVPSRGRRHRLKSTTHGRVMHLMSDLERNAVFELEWRGAVDIREQFPLDRERTRRIARELGVQHPREPRSGVDIVMTTDIVVDVAIAGTTRLVPHFVKPASELGKRRIQEKFEIERRYWESLGSRLQVLTDRELRGPRFENIRWLRDWHWTDGVEGRDGAGWARLADVAMHVVAGMSGKTIGEVCNTIAAAEGITAGSALSVLRHLGSRRLLLVDVDLRRPMLRDPIERFSLRDSASLAAGVAA